MDIAARGGSLPDSTTDWLIFLAIVVVVLTIGAVIRARARKVNR